MRCCRFGGRKVNSSTEKSRDLSTKFVAQNPSAKEVEEIPIVDVSSYSSSGVASNLSGSSRSPPSETPKLSPIVTQSHPSGPPPCRALLLDFEKPRPLMSINAPPPFRFPPPSSTPRAPRPPRCPAPRNYIPRPRFSFPQPRKPQSIPQDTVPKTPPTAEPAKE